MDKTVIRNLKSLFTDAIRFKKEKNIQVKLRGLLMRGPHGVRPLLISVGASTDIIQQGS